MGFLSILRKALPHFADAEKVISAARKDGAKGAAVAVVSAILSPVTSQMDSAEEAALANAAAIDDLYADVKGMEARMAEIERQLKGKK